jgi:hypothetical protein
MAITIIVKRTLYGVRILLGLNWLSTEFSSKNKVINLQVTLNAGIS